MPHWRRARKLPQSHRHSLFASDYGVGGAGSWVLLEPYRPASPLEDYDRGKYMVKRNGAPVWLRADHLVHHSGAELASCREKKAQALADDAENPRDVTNTDCNTYSLDLLMKRLDTELCGSRPVQRGERMEQFFGGPRWG